MKIYLMKVRFEPVVFHPIARIRIALKTIKKRLELFRQYWRAVIKFRNLDWDSDQVWALTSFCSNVNEAVVKLSYELTEDSRVARKLRKRIYSGFDRNWE